VHHPDPFGDVTGQRAGVDYIDEVDRHVFMDPAERTHLLIRDSAGGADWTVLVDDGQWLCQDRRHIGFRGDLVHLCQPHSLQQMLESRIAPERIERWLDLQVRQPTPPLTVGLLQPLERGVRVT
jgi:hypothetical protein